MRHVYFGVTLCAAAWLLAGPVLSDGMEVRPRHSYRHYHHRIVLPPERHVLEKRPRANGSYLINGHWFRAKAPGRPWAAGERIRLVEGEWHGYCVDAAFYNVRRHRLRDFWC